MNIVPCKIRCYKCKFERRVLPDYEGELIASEQPELFLKRVCKAYCPECKEVRKHRVIRSNDY